MSVPNEYKRREEAVKKSAGPVDDSDIRKRILEQGMSSARKKAEMEFSAARERFGLEEVGEMTLEHVRAGDLESAFGMAQDMREVTFEFIKLFGRRGYEVESVGLKYQRALGDVQFRDAERITDSDSPLDVVRTVVETTSEVWGDLESAIVKHAESSAAERLTRPEPKETVEQRVMEDLEAVWEKKFEDVGFGSRVEDFRSSIGLRTLSALVQRYRHLDSRGREEAMPKAYAWAERAYWLTKHAIYCIAQQPEYDEQAPELMKIGLEYEEALGDSSLGRNGSEMSVGARGWEVIRPTEDVTRNTWARIKEAIPEK